MRGGTDINVDSSFENGNLPQSPFKNLTTVNVVQNVVNYNMTESAAKQQQKESHGRTKERSQNKYGSLLEYNRTRPTSTVGYSGSLINYEDEEKH